jgi:hypothetical protein
MPISLKGGLREFNRITSLPKEGDKFPHPLSYYFHNKYSRLLNLATMHLLLSQYIVCHFRNRQGQFDKLYLQDAKYYDFSGPLMLSHRPVTRTYSKNVPADHSHAYQAWLAVITNQGLLYVSDVLWQPGLLY